MALIALFYRKAVHMGGEEGDIIALSGAGPAAVAHDPHIVVAHLSLVPVDPVVVLGESLGPCLAADAGLLRIALCLAGGGHIFDGDAEAVGMGELLQDLALAVAAVYSV